MRKLQCYFYTHCHPGILRRPPHCHPGILRSKISGISILLLCVFLNAFAYAENDSDKYGREDPFEPIFQGVVKTDPKILALEGIVSQGRGLRAVINGEVVNVGDKVGLGNVVIDIKDDRVILSNDAEYFEIKLGEKRE
ncbi:MAG: hypothetical protein ABH844_06940 [Candidatus Omnitrophota bacterium]